jgi:hypothetical protein
MEPQAQPRPSMVDLTPEKLQSMVASMTVQQRQQALVMMNNAIANGQQLSPQQMQLHTFLKAGESAPTPQPQAPPAQIPAEQIIAMISNMSIVQKQQAEAMLKAAVANGHTLTPQQQQLLFHLQNAAPAPATEAPPPIPAHLPVVDTSAAAAKAAEAQKARERALTEEREKAARAEASAREKATAEAAAKLSKQRQAEDKARQEAEERAQKERTAAAAAEAKARAAEEKQLAAQRAAEEKAKVSRPKWMFGKLSRDETKVILARNPHFKGHFLVRQSNTIASGYALSLLTAPYDTEPEHHVLHPDSKGNFTINGEWSQSKLCIKFPGFFKYLS